MTVSGQMVVHVVLLSAALTNNQSYHSAYQQAEQYQQPLLVLVGTAACPGTQHMRAETMPLLEQDGSLSDIAFAFVDRNKHPVMAERLMDGEATPQLVLYVRVAQRWQRSQLTGVLSAADVRSFLHNQISAAEQRALQATQPIIPWQSTGFS